MIGDIPIVGVEEAAYRSGVLVTSPGPIKDQLGNVVDWKPFQYVVQFEELEQVK